MNNIRFTNEKNGRYEYVYIDDKKYLCLDAAQEKVGRQTGKAYVEGMEYLAFRVFVDKSISNDDFFLEVTGQSVIDPEDNISQVLFPTSLHEQNIFFRIFWYLLGVLSLLIALAFVANADFGAAIFMLVCGGILFYFPYCLVQIENSYKVELAEDEIKVTGVIGNAFGKKNVDYYDVCYLKNENGFPYSLLRGQNTIKLKNKYGDYINVYNLNEEFLFTIRDDENFINILKKRCPNIKNK